MRIFAQTMLKFAGLNRQVEEICRTKGYELHGTVRKCPQAEPAWTFAVRTPGKNILVKILVPYPFKRSGFFFGSDKLFTSAAWIPLIPGIGGMVTFPILRDVDLTLPADGFGIPAAEAERVYLIYPAASLVACYHGRKLSPWRPGMEYCGVKIHDGSSFRALLNDPTAVRRFAAFGE